LPASKALCHSPDMTRRDRLLVAGAVVSMALHALAARVAPGALWGVSHLAAWPLAVVLVWTGLGLAALSLLVRGAASAPRRGFPGRRASLLVALAAVPLFWLARERTHFFGDGYLLLRDRGWSETVARGPVLVRIYVAAVAAGGQQLGWTPETTFAVIAVAAGAVAVYLLLRLAAALTPDGGGRWTAAALLGTAGAMQLFCGHVEYYPVLAAGVLAALLALVHAARGGPTLPSWLASAALVPLHLSTLALAPAQVGVGIQAWRAGRRRETVVAALAGVGLATALVRLAGAPPRALAATSLSGPQRYIEPFLDERSPRHAFGLLSPAHLLAWCNDIALVAPMALVALAAAGLSRRRVPGATGPDPVRRTLGLAAGGAALLALLFNREVGPYRDWDNLASFAFVYLACAAAVLVRPHPGPQRWAAAAVLVGGLHHLVPWVVTNATPRAALAHARLVLEDDSQWSPFARGYLHEEIAIWLRQRGDADGSLRAYEAAVRANPSDARYHVGLGAHYFQRGDLQRAEAEFEAALQRRPDYAPAHNNLAFVLVKQGRDLERARRHVDAALAAKPGDADYLTTLGALELQVGRLPEARRALEAALRVRPDAPDARRTLDEVQRREAASRRSAGAP
jgi:tetratricopeptide (TPR) repeat protein